MITGFRKTSIQEVSNMSNQQIIQYKTTLKEFSFKD